MIRRFLAAALLGAAGIALAAPPSLRIGELTSPEVRDAVASGSTTVLIPIGGTEQNGPHLAIGKHNARAAALAPKIAAQLGHTLVAPVMVYVPEGSIDPPSGHMKYPGTISIPPETFERVLEAIARSLRVTGFRDIAFLGDHGGYRKSLDRVAARLNKEWAGEGVRVHAVPEYYRQLPHAGRDDTSLAMALIDERLVRPDLITPEARRQGAEEDPSGATRERGVVLAQQIVDRTVAALKKATAGR
jgi:creatinine amidohydrolase/Fe(II)-dependent formamide hydrolase-like protein